MQNQKPATKSMQCIMQNIVAIMYQLITAATISFNKQKHSATVRGWLATMCMRTATKTV